MAKKGHGDVRGCARWFLGSVPPESGLHNLIKEQRTIQEGVVVVPKPGVAYERVVNQSVSANFFIITKVNNLKQRIIPNFSLPVMITWNKLLIGAAYLVGVLVLIDDKGKKVHIYPV